MKKYTQLTEVQRYQIEALKKAKKEQEEIAAIIGVSASTVSRELKRMDQKTSEVRLEIGLALMSDLKLLNKRHV